MKFSPPVGIPVAPYTATMPVDSPKLLLLAAIIEEINAGKNLEEVLDVVYDRLRDIIPYNRIGAGLVLHGEDRLKMVALKSDGPTCISLGYSGKLRGSTLETLLDAGTPRIINDLEDYLRKKPESESTRLIVKEGMRSSLSLPLVVRGKPVGVLFFSSRAPDTYSDAHVAFLKLISGHIAITVEKSLLMKELRDKSDYLENILRNSADAIVVFDRNDRIQAWNRGAENVFGYHESQVIGKPATIFVKPDMMADYENLVGKIVREGFVSNYETIRMTKDGRPLNVSITSTLIRDEHGRALGRSAILRDQTLMKKLQDDLVQAQSLAAVGELAASVAHEIKNPLAGISGAVQILCRSFAGADPRRHVAQELLQQVKRLDDTVRDLLIFARPWKPQPRPFDLSIFVDSVLSRVETLEMTCGKKIARDLARDCPVEADPQLLEHVLINVIQNAVDAVSIGGHVTVKVYPADTKACIEIRDTGVGIPRQNFDKLFKPFFSTKPRGTGLGLAISKKVVDAHQGSISLESETGKGTILKITLPRHLKEN